MSFIAKLEKVRFVTLGKREGQNRDVGFCYSLTLRRGFLTGTECCYHQGCDTCASGPAPFLLLTLPRVCGDVFDIHRCRSTLQDTDQPSPDYVPISSAIRKGPQSLAKKFPNLTRPVLLSFLPERFSCDHKHYTVTQKKIVMGHRLRGRRSSAFLSRKQIR